MPGTIFSFQMDLYVGANLIEKMNSILDGSKGLMFVTDSKIFGVNCWFSEIASGSVTAMVPYSFKF
jgi:hypothetical protein